MLEVSAGLTPWKFGGVSLTLAASW
jgi:hypothetical protein